MQKNNKISPYSLATVLGLILKSNIYGGIIS